MISFNLGHKSLLLHSLLLLDQLRLLLSSQDLRVAATFIPILMAEVVKCVESLEEPIIKCLSWKRLAHWAMPSHTKMHWEKVSLSNETLITNLTFIMMVLMVQSGPKQVPLIAPTWLALNRSLTLCRDSLPLPLVNDELLFQYSWLHVPDSAIHQHLAGHPGHGHHPSVLLHHNGPVVHLTHLRSKPGS